MTISLIHAGYHRAGRAASSSDRKSWTLEEKLPELLQELELRAIEDDERDAEDKRQAEVRQRRWEEAMVRAKERFIDAHRAKLLRAQVAQRQEVTLMRAYLEELEQAYGTSTESGEWTAWIHSYLERLDPLSQAPTMPPEPEVTADDLKPFLPAGMSPYGPSRW